MSSDKTLPTGFKRVRSIRSSILTTQARRSLRVWDRAKQLHAADVAAGLVPCVAFRALRVYEREIYLAIAEGEVAAPPQFPVTPEEAAHA